MEFVCCRHFSIFNQDASNSKIQIKENTIQTTMQWKKNTKHIMKKKRGYDVK